MDESAEVVKVISEDSALTFLHAKNQTRISVNIKATVKYISEVLRIKQVEIFLIQLLPGLNIFVKKREYMGWHDNILPQRSYIFTHLKPTALNKGCKIHHQVYTVTKNSKVLDGDRVPNTELTVKEWLELSGIDEGSVVLPVDTGDHLEPATAPKLVSYQGVVTAVLDEAMGVYELDHRVRLYVSAVPAVHKYTFIHEGISLTLHNVHCVISKELPKVRLYCCIFSTVEPDRKAIGGKKRSLFPDESLQKLLYVHNVAVAQLDWIYTTRKVVLDNMKTVCGKRNVESIFSVLFASPPWSQDPRNYRNILDEFLSRGHACCLTAGSQCEIEALPRYCTVSQLRCDIEAKSTSCVTGGDYWQFEKKEYLNDQILIGILEISSETARPMLYDKSGCLDTVIASCHGDSLAHLGCHDNCCCDTGQLGNHSSCPYLHNCCVGKIVAINRYTVAMETFVTRGDQQQGSDGLKCHRVLYVEFSLTDAILLCDTLKKNKNIFQESDKQRCKTAKNPASFDKTVNFTDETPEVERSEVEDKRKIDIENRCLIENANVEDDLVLSKVVNATKIEDKDLNEAIDTKTCTDVMKKSVLHRHVIASGGGYFCRKNNCSEGIEKDNYVPVINVKPLVKKRKSPESHDKARSKVLCLSKDRSQENPELETRFMEDSGVTKYDNAKNNTTKIVTETNPESEQSLEGHTRLKSQFDSECSDNCCIVKVTSRESAVIDTCRKDSMSVMFNVQAQIWTKGKFEPETAIIFRGKSVRWYPILWPHTIYKFSIPEEYSPLFKTGLSNSKVEKVVERSKVKRCLLVHDVVGVEQVFERDLGSSGGDIELVDIPIIVDSNAQGLTKFVSFKGQIISRTYSEPEPPKGMLPRNVGQFSPLYSDWSKYQVSTPENRCIRLRVRDLSSRAEIMVFMNLENTVYPLGLLPGVVVMFTRVERKVSRLGNIYARFVSVSSAHLVKLSSSGITLNEKASDIDTRVSTETVNRVFPRQRLVDLWRSKTATSEFHCACDVLQILKLSLKCVCGCCGATLVTAGCSSAGCRMENGSKMVARASFIVDDGTSVAMVTQTGSGIQRLLGLSHDQWACLEEEIRQHGEVFVQRTYPVYGSVLERFVYKLCDNRLVKKTWLMTLRTKQHNKSGTRADIDFNSLSLDDFTEKSMDSGLGTIKTQCLPFLQLDCIGLQQFDASASALHCLTV